MNNKIKHVFLIGAMKCGTTTLYDHLTKHPEIAEGVTKEPDYFSLKMGKPEYKEGKYIDKFKIEKGKHKFTLDASVGYTKFPVEDGVPERIKNYGIDPYLIYIIRNPIDRIKSHYNYMKRDYSWSANIDSPHLINVSKYYMQLEQYLHYFPKEKILIVKFEELKEDPVKLCNKIFKFIGASESKIDIGVNLVKNKTKPINKKQIYLVKKLEFFSKHSPYFLKKLVKSFLNILFPPKNDTLTDIQIKKIKELLKDDIIKLNREFEVNIEKWI